jgi:hypothetical protein
MRKLAFSVRISILALGLVLAGTACPVWAFADDEARRAILDLRQQIQQQNEQNHRARLQLADQLQALQQEVTQLRDQLELVSRQQTSLTPAAAQNPNIPTDASAPEPQEQSTYDQALDLFRKGHCRLPG